MRRVDGVPPHPADGLAVGTARSAAASLPAKSAIRVVRLTMGVVPDIWLSRVTLADFRRWARKAHRSRDTAGIVFGAFTKNN